MSYMAKKDDGIWVAVMIETGRSGEGGTYEYYGRLSKRAFDDLRTSRNCSPLFKLDDPFWLDGSSFVFLAHVKDHGFGSACWFRADSICRLTPLTPGFVKNALKHLRSPKSKKSAEKTPDRKYSSIA